MRSVVKVECPFCLRMIGMCKEGRERLGEPLMRHHKDRTGGDRCEGSGLGLQMAKQILVARHIDR